MVIYLRLIRTQSTLLGGERPYFEPRGDILRLTIDHCQHRFGRGLQLGGLPVSPTASFGKSVVRFCCSRILSFQDTPTYVGLAVGHIMWLPVTACAAHHIPCCLDFPLTNLQTIGEQPPLSPRFLKNASIIAFSFS